MVGKPAGRAATALWIGAVIGVSGVAASFAFPVLVADERLGLGLLFGVRGSVAPPPQAVVVTVAEEAVGVRQPSVADDLPRAVYAELVDELAAAGASAIVFDLFFPEYSDTEPRDPGDPLFVGAVASAANVVLLENVVEPAPGDGGMPVATESRELPFAELRKAAVASAPFQLPGMERLSQYWPFGRIDDDMPMLPTVALAAHLDAAHAELAAAIAGARPALAADLQPAGERAGLVAVIRMIRAAVRGDPVLQGDLRRRFAGAEVAPERRAESAALLDIYGSDGSRYLNYYGPPGTIPTASLADALAGRFDVAGKVVFVGVSAKVASDQSVDAFHTPFTGLRGDRMSGVEVLATAFLNSIERNAVVPLPMIWHRLLLFLWGAALGGGLVLLSARGAAGAAALVGAGYFGLVVWQFQAHGVWWPLVVPLLGQWPLAVVAALLVNYRRALVQRQRVEDALGHYVPRQAVKRLADETLRAPREPLAGTVLCTDARDFAKVSEALTPRELEVLLDEYYEPLRRVVERHGGIVSETVGDSLVAVWVAAGADAGRRARACRAALEIPAAVAEFNRTHPGRTLPTRIGLESGQLLLGDAGEQRRAYRAVSPIVTTASRIEGLNSALGTVALASGATIDGLGLPARELGTFMLRGKTQPVTVFELRAAAADPAGDARFAAALAEFRAGRFDAARRSFAALARDLPGDGPVSYYVGLCGDCVARPPAEWAGIVHVQSK